MKTVVGVVQHLVPLKWLSPLAAVPANCQPATTWRKEDGRLWPGLPWREPSLSGHPTTHGT
jgi:hypothetical protein